MSKPIVAHSGLSHIALRVKDVQRSIAWYQAVMGFEVLTNDRAPTPDRTRSAMGVIAGGALALEFLETPKGRRHDVETLGVAGISVTTPDLDAAITAYNRSPYGGGARAIEAGDWRVAFLFDPDGNVVELVEQPKGLASIAEFADTLRRRRVSRVHL